MQYFRIVEIKDMEITPEMYWALGIGIVVSLLIRFFYCNTLRKTLNLIAEGNRFMKPWEAWLAMIPIFSIYWNFMIAMHMSNSLTNEFYDRKIAEEENPGRSTGLTYACFIAMANLPISSGFMVVTGIVSFVFFVRYWIKMDHFKTVLVEHNRFINSNKDLPEKEQL